MFQASLAEPRAVVQSFIGKFHSAADSAAIQQIDATYQAVQRARAERLAASRDTLHQWMKKVEGAKWETQRPADRSEATHAERMAQLDRDRFSLAKAINELELTCQREDAIRSQMRQRLAKLRERQAALTAAREAVRETDLRRLVYRELGLTWVLPEETTSLEFPSVLTTAKCRIVARKKNDVFTIAFDPAICDPCSDADRLWSLVAQ